MQVSEAALGCGAPDTARELLEELELGGDPAAPSEMLPGVFMLCNLWPEESKWGGGAVNFILKQLALVCSSLWPVGQCPLFSVHQVPELVCPASGLAGVQAGRLILSANCLLGGAAFWGKQEKVSCEVENASGDQSLWAVTHGWAGLGKGCGERRKLLHRE